MTRRELFSQVCGGLGAIGLLTKPFTLDALTQAIVSALAPPVPGPLV